MAANSFKDSIFLQFQNMLLHSINADTKLLR